MEAPKGGTSHAYAQCPEGSALTVLRSLFIQPAPVEAQVVVKAFGFEIESMMEESRGGGGECPHGLRVLAQFTEQHGEDEGAGVIVGAVAFGKIRNTEDSVLEDAGGIGHAREVTQLDGRQFPRLLVERLGSKRLSRRRRHFQPGTLERTHVHLRHVAPDHLAADAVGVLANGVAAGIVPEQAGHFTRDGGCVAEWHQHTAVFRQQFGGVPVGRGDHGFAGAKGVGQRARGDLRFVQVRGDVKVGRADELLEILKVDELVVEDDVLVDFVLLSENFETQPVGFAVLPQLVGMGGAEDNINNLGELRENLRQGIEHVLDALVGRKQSEGEQHHPAFHAELVLEISGIDEAHVGNAVGDEIDLGGGRVVDLL